MVHYFAPSVSNISISLSVRCMVFFLLFLLLRWDTSKVRDRFGGKGRFKGWVNSVIIMLLQIK